MSLRIIYIFFFFLQGLLILLLPYEKLVNLYMHITVGVLLIVIEIVSRVYLEEELAIEESQNQHELVSSPAYYKRQVGLPTIYIVLNYLSGLKPVCCKKQQTKSKPRNWFGE